jgi:purine-binding chemotaxis protein CheW
MTTVTEPIADVEIDAPENQHEWLTFQLGSLRCAVDILRVIEIRTWEAMTRIPYSKSFVQGLINLRGAIVPIVDLRARFGMPERQPDKGTIVLIMHIHTDQGDKTMGIIVDRISEVVAVNDDEITSPARFDLNISASFVHGITDIDDSMVVLLDIDAVLDIEDF